MRIFRLYLNTMGEKMDIWEVERIANSIEREERLEAEFTVEVVNIRGPSATIIRNPNFRSVHVNYGHPPPPPVAPIEQGTVQTSGAMSVGPTASPPTLRWTGFLEWKGKSPSGQNLSLSSECRIWQFESFGISSMVWPERLYISFVRLECLSAIGGHGLLTGSKKLVIIEFKPDEAFSSLQRQMGQEYAAMVFGIGTGSDSTTMRMAFFIRNFASGLGVKLAGGIENDQSDFMKRIQAYKTVHGVRNLMQDPTESMDLDL